MDQWTYHLRHAPPGHDYLNVQKPTNPIPNSIGVAKGAGKGAGVQVPQGQKLKHFLRR